MTHNLPPKTLFSNEPSETTTPLLCKVFTERSLTLGERRVLAQLLEQLIEGTFNSLNSQHGVFSAALQCFFLLFGDTCRTACRVPGSRRAAGLDVSAHGNAGRVEKPVRYVRGTYLHDFLSRSLLRTLV